jgi:hypothetical protein
MTTIDNVSPEQLSALRDEAGAAGDYMMVAIAELAMAHEANDITDPSEYELLDSDERAELAEMGTLDALRKCVESINDAAAQA